MSLPGILLLVALGAVAVALQVVIHETGHLVFGLLTGYRFQSFRVGPLMVVRQRDGRLALRQLSLKGTGGQCLMSPPDLVDERMPYRLYNLGGSLMNALVGGGCALACFLISERNALTLFLALMGIVGIAYALMNGLPMQVSGISNDGRNARDAGESPEALRGLWLNLKVGESLANGVRLKDLPDEWFAIPSPEGMANPLAASAGAFASNRLLDAGDVDGAAMLIRHLLERPSGLLGMHRSALRVDLAYCELVGPNRACELDAILNAETGAFMRGMGASPSVLRTRYAQALLADGDETAAHELRAAFEAAAERYPYPCEIEGERALLDRAQTTFAERRGRERAGSAEIETTKTFQPPETT